MPQNAGQVAAVRGSVIDARFDHALPAIRTKLRTPPGQEPRVIVEVLQHLGGGLARCVALTATEGLRRGDELEDTGRPITIPLDESILGRMINVFGEPIDKGEPLGGRPTPIYQQPVPLREQETGRDVYETGIKAID
ncbi:MAG: F0F1 ATP synthase subunit beta, partial [Spirochaetota bacterium]